VEGGGKEAGESGRWKDRGVTYVIYPKSVAAMPVCLLATPTSIRVPS
jgi:hypothetical protein